MVSLQECRLVDEAPSSFSLFALFLEIHLVVFFFLISMYVSKLPFDICYELLALLSRL